VLVVASRLKGYIRRTAGYNTSDAVLPILSAAIRRLCDEAIRNARRAERQTVLDRDVPGEP
jgi:histone H3/H4